MLTQKAMTKLHIESTENEAGVAISSHETAPRAASSFWSRHKTLINFWLDAVLLVLFMVQAWMLTVLATVFPRGIAGATVWGRSADEWLDALFAVFCIFSVGVVVHVMFHWAWVCGTVATRILGRKPGKDDGSQTLIGVGFLIFLLHLLGAAVLAARVGVVLKP